MRRWFLLCGVIVSMMVSAVFVPSAHALGAGTWTWPVTGPVIRAFDPPQDPYGSGHRGIDIAAPTGTPVVAVERGTVTFAGAVGGHLFVTVSHDGDLASTYSWVSAVLVRRGDVVAAGQVIARSGAGHPGSLEPSHLHVGVRLAGAYVDPLAYLTPLTVSGLIRLAPLTVARWATPLGASRG
jgi:murein DD-endopeptidase MepM/ murein hydrolase activator NlpD